MKQLTAIPRESLALSSNAMLEYALAPYIRFAAATIVDVFPVPV